MPAEKIRDSRFEIKVPGVNPNETDTTTVVLDSEGNWCNIPNAHDTQTLIDLIGRHFRPNLDAELRRLEQRKAFLPVRPDVEQVVGVHLLSYKPPQSDAFEQEEWKSGLAQHMKAAGFDIDPIPPYLLPSFTTSRGFIVGQEPTDPYAYWRITNLLNSTFIIAPALSRFGPPPYNIGTTNEVTLGYNAAIGVDGAALMGLLEESVIHRSPLFPGEDRVLSVPLFNAVKKVV